MEPISNICSTRCPSCLSMSSYKCVQELKYLPCFHAAMPPFPPSSLVLHIPLILRVPHGADCPAFLLTILSLKPTSQVTLTIVTLLLVHFHLLTVNSSAASQLYRLY